MQVREIMKEARVINKDISLAEAAEIMSANGLSSLLFVRGNRIRGILTERDLLKNFNKQEMASNVMSKKVIVIGPDEEIGTALEIMKDYKKKKLPVVEGGKLIGVVNLIDIAMHADDLGEGFFFD